MDVDQARLDAVYEICLRYTREIGGQVLFEKTLSREESLMGADFVISTALTAPHERLRAGWAIAKKYGFRFGGSYHVMYDEAFWVNFYQLRFMEELTRDILRICPDAWHLMVSNPVVAGTTLLQRKYPAAKMVGLCHGYAMTHKIAEQMGYDRDALSYQMPGVNHFVWMHRARVNGEDFFPILDQWIREKGEEYWKTCGLSAPLSRKRLDFYKKHGVVGIGDTVSWTGASWPWWYHSDDEVEKAFGEYAPEDGWNGYFRSVEKNARDIIALAADPARKVSDFLPSLEGDDLMVPLVESLARDIPRVLIVNVLNRGALVPGVPEDFEVEVPALCDAGGVHPIQTDPLPRHMIAHILRDRVAPVEMELEAYERGNLDFLLELVLMDKWASSEVQVRAFIGEILDMPGHEAMKAHYIRQSEGI
jgi:alpha-galactosidase